MGDTDKNQLYWEKGIRSTRLKINTAWFLSALARPLAGFFIIAALVLFYFRWVGDLDWMRPSFIIASLFITTLIYVVVTLAGKWEGKQDTVVRIDDSLSLNNQLSMAVSGRAPFPEIKALPKIYDWKAFYFLPPLLIGLLGLILAAFIPIKKAPPTSFNIQEPLAWEEMEEELEMLKEEELVEEEYIAEKEKELEALKTQDQEDWYEHSSLEATDHLVNQHKEEKNKLADALENAAEQLEKMESGKGNPGALKSAFNEFQESLKGMENAQMKPNKELLEQMKGISPESLKQLSPEEIEKLKSKLQEGSDSLSEGDGAGDDGEGAPQDGKKLGNGWEGSGEGEEQGSGEPGINRGPGHDELLYGDTHERLNTEKDGGLEAQDLSDFTPGDLLELQDAAPQAEEKFSGVRASGITENQGRGGNRVWKQALLPAEQEALKFYFSNEPNDK